MRYVLSEYGLLVLAIIAGIFAFTIVDFMFAHYKNFSKYFIGNMTGSYVDYDAEISLEDIEAIQSW